MSLSSETPLNPIALAVRALERLAADEGNAIDASRLLQAELYFLADLPLNQSRKRFAQDDLPADQAARLNAVLAKATGRAIHNLGGVRHAPAPSAAPPQ